MPKQLGSITYDITSSGGVHSFTVKDKIDLYIITATTTPTLASAMEFIHADTPNEGMKFHILYTGGVTQNLAGGKPVSFFGTNLNDAQALSVLDITATYSSGAWIVVILPSNASTALQAYIDGEFIIDNSIPQNALKGLIPLSKIFHLTAQGYLIRGGAAGALEDFNAATSGAILIGNGTTVNSVIPSGDVTIDGSGVTTIGANKVLTTNILDANITTSKLENNLKYEVILMDVSFEAAGGTVESVGDFTIKMPYPGTVNEIYAYATKAIAATDNGTITPKNNAGTTMTSGVITFTASDARGTSYTVTPSANNTFVAGDILKFTTAKTTAGGTVKLSIKITRS